MDKQEVMTLLQNTDENKIREFLLEAFENDKDLLNRFYLMKGQVTTEIIKDYKKRINKIFRDHAKGGYIDYRVAGSFADSLVSILVGDIPIFIKNGSLDGATDLVNYSFTKLWKQDMDDSNGEKVELTYEILALWNEILDEADAKLSKKMFNWFHKELGKADYGQWEYLNQVLSNNFNDVPYLQRKLELADKRLAEIPNDGSWQSRYNKNTLAVHRINVMVELGMQQVEIDEFCKRNWDFSDVRMYFIESCLKSEEFDAAMHVLEESIELDKQFAGLVSKYYLMLKDIYKEQGHISDYKDTLWWLLKNNNDTEAIYLEYKALFSELEWSIEQEKVIHTLKSGHRHLKYLKLEGQYEELKNAIFQLDYTSYFLEYEKILMPFYPNEILGYFEKIIRREAQNANNRSGYKKVVSLLKAMKKTSEGAERAAVLVAEFKKHYVHRPAMLEIVAGCLSH